MSEIRKCVHAPMLVYNACVKGDLYPCRRCGTLIMWDRFRGEYVSPDILYGIWFK